MVTTDGFILSHCLEVAEILEDETVKKFIGEHPKRPNVLDIGNPLTIGALDLQDYYFEHKRQQSEAMTRSLNVIAKIGKEFGDKFGRYYDFVESYKLDDADVAIVVMGSTTGSAKDVIDQLRNKGKKVGLLKIRVFRPFPIDAIKNSLKHVKVIGVMDRSDGVNGVCGSLYPEICSSLYEADKRPTLVNYIYGLGGREVREEDIQLVYSELFNILEKGKTYNLKYIGVRE